ncbi:MAG: hypothetical protein ACK4KV_10350 [Rhodocyclaceae bacterium]
MTTADDLARMLAPHGLRLRGVLRAGGDVAVVLPDGRPTAALALVGNVGSELWPVFSAASELTDGLADPLDRWTRRIGEALAARLNAAALFPFTGPPFHPFQRWAMRAGGVVPSPLGLLVHPTYGLWHAYRFALLLPAFEWAADQGEGQGSAADGWPTEAAPGTVLPTDLCAACDGRPCLSACPVGAFDGGGYRLASCAAHLRSHAGQRCAEVGCAARLACPLGQGYRYQRAHQRFHMNAFVAARLGEP